MYRNYIWLIQNMKYYNNAAKVSSLAPGTPEQRLSDARLNIFVRIIYYQASSQTLFSLPSQPNFPIFSLPSQTHSPFLSPPSQSQFHFLSLPSKPKSHFPSLPHHNQLEPVLFFNPYTLLWTIHHLPYTDQLELRSSIDNWTFIVNFDGFKITTDHHHHHHHQFNVQPPPR